MPSKPHALTEKYLQEVFKHGDKDLIMLVIQHSYDFLLKKGYTKEQLKTGKQFLQALTAEAINFWNKLGFLRPDTKPPEEVLHKLMEALTERALILSDGSQYGSYRVAYAMSRYPLSNIVVPYEEWRVKMDLIDKGSEDANANLDF